jgi:hypothetical protein
MTGSRVGRALAAAVAVLALCACQPRPVVGTVVDKYTYPDGTRRVCVDGVGDRPVCASPYEPPRYYVSVRSDADPDGPTNQIEVDQYLYLDLEVGDRFDELEMVGP